jgi:periplasmic divalent cation tolerance protein
MEYMKEKYIQVITTIDTKEDAEKITEILLNRRLAGCIQIIGPVTSTYWWKNKIEKASEWLCIVKSTKNLFEEIKQSIREIHPYETPEIISIPIVNGDNDYLKWLQDKLKK